MNNFWCALLFFPHPLYWPSLQFVAGWRIIQYRKKRDGKKVPHTKLNIARHSNQFVRISRNEETKYCCICSFLPRAKIYLFTSSHISSERFYSDCLLTSTANWRKEKCMEKKRTAKTECRFDSFFFYSTFQMIVKRASAIKRLKCMKK